MLIQQNPAPRRRNGTKRIAAGLSTRGRRRRRIKLIASAVAAVAVLGGLLFPLAVPCGGELWDDGGECVGISDGSTSFHPEFDAVAAKIWAENQRVAGQRGITIAVLVPIPLPSESGQPPNGLLSTDQIRALLEGAHVAQVQANRYDLKVRLVLANEGSREQAWQPVVGELERLVRHPQPLVAVTGLGVSVQQTVDGARALAAAGIPSIGSVITADGLNTTGTGAYGLVRVNSSNDDQLAALAEFLPRNRPDLRKALVVADTNPADFYTRTLREGFERHFGAYWDGPRPSWMPYSGVPRTPGIVAQFNSIAGRLCGDNPPDVFFYAGRAILLPDFVAQLRQRGCVTDRPVTVVTASDASDLQVALGEPGPNDSPVSVIYTGLAEPKALKDPRWNPTLDQYQRFEAEFRNNGFPEADLRNGWAIMQHDAVLAAAQASRTAIGQGLHLPAPTDVLPQLYLMNDPEHVVTGAGGSFQFDPVTGDAVGRRIPILELTPAGQVDVLDVVG
ncbi:hypothetical protein ABT337_32305 [Saccharopolyspora hirsuta]|uniref:hypothetical protein n=1 Tax=Saccharopolyspora hirsuta TaxID=1837 RepID=UPI0033194A74